MQNFNEVTLNTTLDNIVINQEELMGILFEKNCRCEPCVAQKVSELLIEAWNEGYKQGQFDTEPSQAGS